MPWHKSRIIHYSLRGNGHERQLGDRGNPDETTPEERLQRFEYHQARSNEYHKKFPDAPKSELPEEEQRRHDRRKRQRLIEVWLTPTKREHRYYTVRRDRQRREYINYKGHPHSQKIRLEEGHIARVLDTPPLARASDPAFHVIKSGR